MTVNGSSTDSPGATDLPVPETSPNDGGTCQEITRVVARKRLRNNCLGQIERQVLIASNRSRFQGLDANSCASQTKHILNANPINNSLWSVLTNKASIGNENVNWLDNAVKNFLQGNTALQDEYEKTVSSIVNRVKTAGNVKLALEVKKEIIPFLKKIVAAKPDTFTHFEHQTFEPYTYAMIDSLSHRTGIDVAISELEGIDSSVAKSLKDAGYATTVQVVKDSTTNFELTETLNEVKGRVKKTWTACGLLEAAFSYHIAQQLEEKITKKFTSVKKDSVEFYEDERATEKASNKSFENPNGTIFSGKEESEYKHEPYPVYTRSIAGLEFINNDLNPFLKFYEGYRRDIFEEKMKRMDGFTGTGDSPYKLERATRRFEAYIDQELIDLLKFEKLPEELNGLIKSFLPLDDAPKCRIEKTTLDKITQSPLFRLAGATAAVAAVCFWIKPRNSTRY